MDFSRFLSNSEICRACLKQKGESTRLVSVDALESEAEELTIGQKLLQCFPELDLKVTPNAVVCASCLSAINFVLGFKKVCVQIQDDIQKIGLSHVNLIDLIEKTEEIKQNPDSSVQESEVKEDSKCDSDKIDIKDELPYHASSLIESVREAKNSEVVEIKNEDKVTEAESMKKQITLLLNDLAKKIYECSWCNYQTNLKNLLDVHVKLHENNKLLKCTKRMCKNPDVKTGVGDKPYKCNFSVTKSHAHARPPPQFNCTECVYSASSISVLRRHILRHKGAKPYKCKYCSYSSKTSRAIKSHTIIHTGERFKCSHCDYSSRTRFGLSAHAKIHAEYRTAGDMQLTCTECEFVASCTYSLERHAKTHAGNKSYRCTVCDYCARTKCSLAVHMRIHAGDEA